MLELEGSLGKGKGSCPPFDGEGILHTQVVTLAGRRDVHKVQTGDAEAAIVGITAAHGTGEGGRRGDEHTGGLGAADAAKDSTFKGGGRPC